MPTRWRWCLCLIPLLLAGCVGWVNVPAPAAFGQTYEVEGRVRVRRFDGSEVTGTRAFVQDTVLRVVVDTAQTVDIPLRTVAKVDRHGVQSGPTFLLLAPAVLFAAFVIAMANTCMGLSC